MVEAAGALALAAGGVWILGLDGGERNRVLAEAGKLFKGGAA